MDKLHIAAGVLLFALVTAMLYVWGLKKSVQQGEDLTRILMNRCGNRIMKYLRHNGTITRSEAARQINGVTAGEAWSRKRLTVQEPDQLIDQVLAFLVDQQYLEPTEDRDTFRRKQ